MARQFPRDPAGISSASLADFAAATAAARPCSIAGWVRLTEFVSGGTLVSYGGSSGFQISIASTQKLNVAARGTPSTEIQASTSAVSLDTWHFFGGSLSADGTVLACVLDNERLTKAISAHTLGAVAQRRLGQSSNQIVCELADVAIFNVELTAAEFASLYAAGPPAPSPLLIRPDAILNYWRLLQDDDDRDYVGPDHLGSVTGSPAYAQHPGIVYPTGPHYSYIRPNQGIRPAGIASAEAFGTPALAQRIGPTGIASAEAFGAAFIGSLVRPTGIASAEAFGTPVLVIHTEITPAGIASGELFGSPWVGDHQIIIPFGIESGEALGGAGLTVQLLHRLRPRIPVFASDRPFQGEGISVYANLGETVQYRNVRVVGRLFRRHRRIWIKGTPTPHLPIGANPIAKTARKTSAAGTSGQTLSPAFSIPSVWGGQTVAIDVRHYRDDVENLTDNFRTLRVDLDGTLEETTEIRGTADLLTPEIRAGGIVRLRFAWKPARDGIQPTLFRIQRTAGPTSPADVTAAAVDRQRIYEIDTPALSDAAPYTYSVLAENGATVATILSGISFTADATGPPAVSGVMTDAR